MIDEEKYCETCNHIEMCKWTPISGCAFHSKYEQRPHGKWEKKPVYYDYFYCSECGYAYRHAFNFCPNCGSDNRKKGDENA